MPRAILSGRNVSLALVKERQSLSEPVWIFFLLVWIYQMHKSDRVQKHFLSNIVSRTLLFGCSFYTKKKATTTKRSVRRMAASAEVLMLLPCLVPVSTHTLLEKVSWLCSKFSQGFVATAATSISLNSRQQWSNVFCPTFGTAKHCIFFRLGVKWWIEWQRTIPLLHESHSTGHVSGNVIILEAEVL